MNENHVNEVADKSGQFNALHNQVLHCGCKKKLLLTKYKL